MIFQKLISSQKQNIMSNLIKQLIFNIQINIFNQWFYIIILYLFILLKVTIKNNVKLNWIHKIYLLLFKKNTKNFMIYNKCLMNLEIALMNLKIQGFKSLIIL